MQTSSWLPCLADWVFKTLDSGRSALGRMATDLVMALLWDPDTICWKAWSRYIQPFSRLSIEARWKGRFRHFTAPSWCVAHRTWTQTSGLKGGPVGWLCVTDVCTLAHTARHSTETVNTMHIMSQDTDTCCSQDLQTSCSSPGFLCTWDNMREGEILQKQDSSVVCWPVWPRLWCLSYIFYSR